MPFPLASLPAALHVTLTPPPPLDGMASALLTALAPVWPALAPWLLVCAVAVVMRIATEVVVRELHGIAAATPRATPAEPPVDAPARPPRA
jgi:hypothetical protein